MKRVIVTLLAALALLVSVPAASANWVDTGSNDLVCVWGYGGFLVGCYNVYTGVWVIGPYSN
ncbi:MAG: hypothetical protein K0S82_1793 [Gaiellaceae bacterium]|nr:hypothetical protein [Gaiellaceae bacterium]